jgi:hypothetical protein
MDRHIQWARPHPFALGQVIGAFTVGVLAGSFLNLPAVMVLCVSLAAGAAVSAMICRWRPGFEAAGWKLWLVGAIANPVTLSALAYSTSEYECLLGTRTGWDCMLVEIGLFVAGIGSVPPIVGIVVRWRNRRSQRQIGHG